MKKLLLPVVVLAAGLTLLSGCATPTPYAAAGSAGYQRYATGYSDTRIEDNRFRITFKGNDLTSRETVENYMLYHAADLTLQSGYDWFEIVKRATDEKKRAVTTFTDPFMDGMSYRFYRRSGWSVWGGGFGFDDTDTFEYTRYEASAEIIMHKGAKPDAANAYDARSVKSNLESKIIRPTPGK